MEGTQFTVQVEQAWMRLASQWRGEAADAFRGMYVLRLRDSAESFEAGCVRLREATASLSSELDEIERQIQI